jgi:hypothetical protein
VTSVGPLVLRIIVATGGRHHEPVANVIRIAIASFSSWTHK